MSIRYLRRNERYTPDTLTDYPLYEKLKYAAANKLQSYSEHRAGGGSYYVYAGNIKIRISNHENLSKHYSAPDYNLIKKDITEEIVNEIIPKIDYPRLSKQRVFSWFVGSTAQKLKKILPENVYVDICEDSNYPNTFTKYIDVEKALDILKNLGYTQTFPVRQEYYSYEDYCGKDFF